MTEESSLLIKAIQKQDELEYSPFKWAREYEEAYIDYINTVLSGIATGLALELNVDPDSIKKEYKIPKDVLMKAIEGKEVDDFYKSIFTKYKNKYKKTLNAYKKFGFKKQSVTPIKFSKKILYNPETRAPLTDTQWRSISKDITNYLKEYFDDAEDETVVNAGLFGLLQMKMDQDGIEPNQQLNKNWNALKKRYGSLTKLKKEVSKDSVLDYTLKYSKSQVGKYLSIQDGELKNQIISTVRTRISEGLHEGLSPQEMVSDLFWTAKERDSNGTVDAWQRDWKRVVLTEMSAAENNGYIAAQKDATPKQKIYFVFAGPIVHNSAQICRESVGMVLLLVDGPLQDDFVDDKYAHTAIWIGKNNIGRHKDNWWTCAPAHPNCHHRYVRINPQQEEWNEKLGKVQFKIEKSEEQEKLNLIKNDPVKKVKEYRGVKINIEWPYGTVRSYPGSKYKNNMHSDYGYIQNTDSPDGEEVDVYLAKDPRKTKVYMLNQMTPDGKEFDEHKFMLGFKNQKAAIQCYKKTMTAKMYGGIVSMSMKKFKKDLVKFYRKKNLKKAANISIDNIEWKDKERVSNIKKELPTLMNKIKKYVKITSPVIVHLYKTPKEISEKRAHFDLGTINIYSATPQWRGDFLHELGHQLFRPQNLSDDTKIKLLKMKERLEKSKGDRRIFIVKHLYENTKEIIATLFKWWISGKILDKSFTTLLKKYEPEGYKLIEDIINTKQMEKSFK